MQASQSFTLLIGAAGFISAEATHSDGISAFPPLALPATIKTAAATNQALIVAQSSAGPGAINISCANLPEGFTLASGGTTSAYLNWRNWGGAPAGYAVHSIPLTIEDAYGNVATLVLTVNYRQSWTKANLKHVAVRAGALAWQFGDYGAINQAVSGVVSLNLKISRYEPGGEFDGSNLTVQYLLDEQPLGSPQPGNVPLSWDSATVSNSSHVLSVRILDAVGEHLAGYRVLPSLFRVCNGPPDPQTLPACELAIHGSGAVIFDTQNDDDMSVAPDFIAFPGIRPRRANSFPYPVSYAPPANLLPDPSVMRDAANWFLEPLTHHREIWGNAVPTWLLDENDIPFAGQHFPRVALESSQAVGLVSKFADWCGPRNDNSISEYSTFAPVPSGNGWIGIQLDGRMFHLRPNGSVRTIAGHAIAPASTVVPKDPRNPNITAAQVAAHQETLVQGNFIDGPFDLPNDLAFDPNDHTIVYVADTHRHRIAKVQFSNANFDAPTIITYKDLGAYEPYSLTVDPDGTMWIAERDVGKVLKLDAALVVTEHASVVGAQVVKQNSLGQIIVGSPATKSIYRVDKATGTVTLIVTTTFIDPGPNLSVPTWLWLDVDRYALIGPRDSIYFASSITLADATYGLNGARSEVAVVTVDAAGNFVDMESFLWSANGGGFTDGQGTPTSIFDPFGHYVWAISIHATECRFLTAGFGGVGVCSWRAKLPADPDWHPEDYACFRRGQRLHLRGTVPAFPMDSRPSFASVHGRRGFNYFGNIRNFDDLAALDDAALTAEIHTGLDGSVPRPEITGNDLRDYLFFIRRCSLQGHLSGVRPGPDDQDTVPPIITGAQWIGSTLTWDTNEPTIGVVEYGPSDYYGLHSPVESGFGLSHSLTLDAVPAFWRIVARDVAGNVAEFSA